MHPLNFGKKSLPMKKSDKFDLTTRVSKPVGGVIASITPRGQRLNLQPIGAQLFVEMGNEDDPQQIGGIHLPVGAQSTFNQFKEVPVVSVGPEVKQVKAGDKVLLARAQVDRVVHEGNDYWRTTETAIIGIIR